MKASDLSEPAILAVLARQPGVWHGHWTGCAEFGNQVLDPTHPDAPEKVLIAKLRSMERRGIIGGCGCGCRGDWHWPPNVTGASADVARRYAAEAAALIAAAP